MSGLDEKGRYCTCNSKTNPCIVCSKPKFIDPEWLKRKIEEEPDGMEVGAGFEIFSTPDTVAATPADVSELVERSLPSYGSLSFDALGRDVREAQIGARVDYDFDTTYYKGHQPVSGINFNSLNRIVSKYAAALERVVRERDNLQARLTARAKSMLCLREALAGVHDNIEDEGDRTYFGSTNDADTFREVWQDLDAWAWDDIMSDGKMTDVYAASREAHTRLESAEAKLAEARKVIEPFAEASIYHAAFGDERPVRADGDVKVKHLRAARRFLEETK